MSIFSKIAEAAVLPKYPTLPLISKITSTIINPALGLLTAIALVVFLWGVVQFLKKSAEGKDDKEEGKNHMIWGVIGLFIMLSALGIFRLIESIWK